ncbi:MAG: hypothetical protein FJ125_02470 [Deltaproteobacteria bacterium]|nr:hypothetical protein [Deltaproteobacteria bacterium]
MRRSTAVPPSLTQPLLTALLLAAVGCSSNEECSFRQSRAPGMGGPGCDGPDAGSAAEDGSLPAGRDLGGKGPGPRDGGNDGGPADVGGKGEPELGPAPDAGEEPLRSGVGPRPLPPTFIPLELERFPRPAAEACRGNRNRVRVAVGQSIARAVAAAPPGTTIWIEPGSYTEAGATAIEWETDRLCLRAADGGEVVLQATPGQRHGISPQGDDAVLEGFTLRGFTSSIGLWQGGGRTQQRVTIERVRVEQPAGPFGEGIVAYGDNRDVAGTPPVVDGLLLLDVAVEGTDMGISCNHGPCAHWWVERTSVTGRRGAGSSGADTLAVENGRQIVVVDSVFANADADGIDVKGSEVVVLGALVKEMGRNGIKLWQGGDVIDTIVDGTGADAAITGARAARYRYLHVLVTRHGTPQDHQYVGTWAYDHPSPELQLEIVNCIFYRNATGGLFVPAGSSLSIRHTLFDDPQAKLIDAGGQLTLRVAQLDQLEANGWGNDNLVGDPRFIDVAQGQFATLPDSPARDAAEPVEGLERDFSGAPRLAGNGPDIGPVESPVP